MAFTHFKPSLIAADDLYGGQSPFSWTTNRAIQGAGHHQQRRAVQQREWEGGADTKGSDGQEEDYRSKDSDLASTRRP